jgi:pimeloyl-ACP methyl ester carboxylesterase
MICRALLLALIAAAAIVAAPAAQSQDLQREARWRAEIAPAVLVGEPVDLDGRAGHKFLGLYSPGAADKPAIVLVHGSGMHPDFGIVGRLRMDLADAGFTTLSIQMPVLAAGSPAADYAPLMPDAAQRIGAAAAWLRAKGHRRLVLAGHSLGARMSHAYFEATEAPAYDAFISLAIVGGSYSTAVLSRKRPIFDLYAERDFDAVLADSPQRAQAIRAIAGSRQVRIDGTDHFFAGRERAVAEAVMGFLGGK